ncbi:hypothetical protein KUTeg_012401 [Tegillarca granosa]|uniref:Reverse transcriptase domain-containing protein n=1 Tax=Tegillarca granosa TaxID=220873 RepID=A0ABQ9EZF9_TEGGR|nr:hypothetical protein KUTeg_012401 [Tegillarca granosa]
MLHWISSYLLDRQQKVVLDGHSSSFRSTSAGVPQGSVLGPFLFLLYINDIVDNLNSNVRLFADDTCLFVIVNNDPGNASSILSDDLSTINSWSMQWAVDFNPSKTESIVFTRRHLSHPHIFFGTEQVASFSSHCHLGLTLQSDATWSKHISNIYKKACSRITLLRMLKYQLDRNSLLTIYKSFIRPILEYGDVIWDNCTQQDADLLESVQVECARIITGLRRNCSRTVLYFELGLESLEARRRQHKLITFYKAINGYAPAYLQHIIHPYFPADTGYNLRHSGQFFQLPLCRTSSYFNSFLPSTIKLWNELPITIKSATSIASFKSKLKSYFYTSEINPSFNYGSRVENIHHCQLRNFSSNLKRHLFDHFIENDPSCPKCGSPSEDNQHFLFDCVAFSQHRQKLFDAIYSITGLPSIDLQILLHGSPEYSYGKNTLLFQAVHAFIKDSQRFKSSNSN